MARSRILSARVAELLVVAVVGGALALGGAAAFGKLGSTTTVQQVTRSATIPTTSQTPATGGALTAEQIYHRDAPGVVQITATSVSQVSTDPFNLLPTTPQTSESLGSGFVIDKAGHIVTNYHVIQGAKPRARSAFSGQERDHRPRRRPRSLHRPRRPQDRHLAGARALTPLALGDSDLVRVGDSVAAIGNPLGEDRSITSGIVSALERRIYAPNGAPIDHAIQTDAALNHGNSGGPLLDANGQVIGVTSQIQTSGGDRRGQGNVGIGFAIPINTVRNVAAQIISSGKAEHAFVGVQARAITPAVAKLFRLPVSHGLLVQQRVQRGHRRADKAGLREGKTAVTVVQGDARGQLGGDIIVKRRRHSGDPSVEHAAADAISQRKPGDNRAASRSTAATRKHDLEREARGGVLLRC